MDDKTTSLMELRDLIASFIEERQWQQFHTPKNLAMSVAIEAAELMELFQWSGEQEVDEEKLARVREELADVVIYCLAMANTLDIDLSQAVRDKVVANGKKYPVESYKGRYSLK
ncbi:MAG: nucleotide pyrophosphohydrolase [Desulfotomaculaceae bacterium]|nr:nucleotide pyrophosphohydrolase [Desulfotomaculaceae bacterium]